MAQGQNPFLLAADNSPALLPLLRQDPSQASAQDEHGYSLVHAAASYNHLDLLRALVLDFKVDVNLRDEDDETPLFVVETVEAAKVLVEELAADVRHTGSDGLTAADKIEADGDFPAVAAYLKTLESAGRADHVSASVPDVAEPSAQGIEFTLGTLDPTHDIPDEVDPEFRRRIEELAQKDLNTPSGQADLRQLVEDAISNQGLADERHTRPRHA
ncbi:hypothetical protein CDD83_9100 [Cordyceps sp. RAO-2017]|nr:hypothetical protein CDD83_9100 [Cordyceps sp. RAO-2017]